MQRDGLRRRQIARSSIAWSFRCFLRFCRFVGVYDYQIIATLAAFVEQQQA
jgi:hypothetical protein